MAARVRGTPLAVGRATTHVVKPVRCVVCGERAESVARWAGLARPYVQADLTASTREEAIMGIVDIHSHLIPGVDDGATDEAEARSALTAFVAQGVTRAVITPHVEGTLTRAAAGLAVRLKQLDAGWDRLGAVQRLQAPQLELHRGAEVLLDTPEPDLRDDRLRLAGTDFALVEFPFVMVPPHSSRVLLRLREQGVRPIIAHPERYAGVSSTSELPADWRRAGALLAVNGASLLGRYGTDARATAFALLERGLVDYLASDYHARGTLHIAAYRELLHEHGAAEHVQLLTEVNPARILDNQPPIPVPPLRLQRGVWARFRARLWR